MDANCQGGEKLMKESGSFPSYDNAISLSLTPIKMIHSLPLAVCSLQQYNIGEQSRSRIHFQP
jgi:hypothetical protein